MDDFELVSWSAILKVVLAGIAVYVIQPMLLVIRDAVLWKAIERWILNNDLDIWIAKAVADEETMKTFPKLMHADFTQEVPVFKHDGVMVPRLVYETTERNHRNTRSRLLSMYSRIDSRKRRLDWILRHYKQPTEENPIVARLRQEREIREEMKKRVEGAEDLSKPRQPLTSEMLR